MSRRIPNIKFVLAALVAVLVLHSESLFACAACFGKSDSRLAVGMNWGIFSLLGVVVCVLSGFAAFGIYLARKSASVAATAAVEQAPASTQKD
ncbi:MAG: hypothetical protein JWR19_2575 [Pedosphaera sp.]|nr:hypothetical protein [Pedosphaera sp.]